MTRESTKAQEKGEPPEGLKPDILSNMQIGEEGGGQPGQGGGQTRSTTRGPSTPCSQHRHSSGLQARQTPR